jgi:hypothetical protein
MLWLLGQAARHRLGYGIADSPVGLAAWMIDHDIRSYSMIARVFNGQTEGLTRDDILDNVTLYWLTNTAISSARLYWDATQISTGGGFFDVRGVKIPVAVSVFPDETYAAPRSWAERAYPKLIHYNRLERADTLRPGNSQSFSAQSSEPRSNRCADASRSIAMRAMREKSHVFNITDAARLSGHRSSQGVMAFEGGTV